jgi:hypothetical protein
MGSYSGRVAHAMDLDYLVDCGKIEPFNAFFHESDAPSEEAVDVADDGTNVLPTVEVVPAYDLVGRRNTC